MNSKRRPRALIAALLALVLVLGIAACGDDDDEGGGGGGGAQKIESNPANGKVSITVGSKNFTEQYILGEIYAQGLEAAGYTVKKQLNLGDEFIALKALQDGQIDAYPEYASTALTSFFDFPPQDVPSGDPQGAYQESKDDFAKLGLQSFPPAPFSSANAFGLLKSRASELGVKTISDLEGKSQDLTLFGSPECRQRIDCLLGLEQLYGLEFKKFTPIDIGLRYEVLDNGQADLSIIFTTDALLSTSDKYTVLEDDKEVLPAGNPLFIASDQIVKEAGPDLGKTVEQVQGGLTIPVMQELNARVDIDKQTPQEVAHDYLQESGYID
jgi:glycine betaine/choline ABC-type transport system substrate-binding protein